MRIATVALSLIGCTMGVAASARPISQDEQWQVCAPCPPMMMLRPIDAI